MSSSSSPSHNHLNDDKSSSSSTTTTTINKSAVCATYSPPYVSSSSFGSSSSSSSMESIEFGWSVATTCDGSRVLIGSANDPSAVYMYMNSIVDDDPNQSSSAKWMKTFHNPHGKGATTTSYRSSQFGLTVAMNSNGQRILIADPSIGLVYLYDDRGHLLHTFHDPDFDDTDDIYTAPETMFGTSLAISDDGNIVVIGAPDTYVGETIGGAGAVYLYYNPSMLQQQRQQQEEGIISDNKKNHQERAKSSSWKMAPSIIKPTDPIETNDNFGISVALNGEGTKLVIGAWNVNDTQGEAYLYDIFVDDDDNTYNNDGSNNNDKTNNNEIQLFTRFIHNFHSPQLMNSKWFGYSVDITQQFVFIGSRGETVNHQSQAGAVYVYSLLDTPYNDKNYDENWDGTTYTTTGETNKYKLIDTITAPMPIADQQFGGSVSATGSRILIGSYGLGSVGTGWDGSVHLYEQQTIYVAASQRNRANFNLLSKIPIATLSASSFNGISVSLSKNGKYGIVGIPSALGKNGFTTTGSAIGLCLPSPINNNSTNDNQQLSSLYTCPNIHLTYVSWTSSAFWLSWDSWSGKCLALIVTIAVCCCILFYRTKSYRRGNHRPSRHRFELIPSSTSSDQDDFELELHVIREESVAI